jgi:hypothetical protein
VAVFLAEGNQERKERQNLLYRKKDKVCYFKGKTKVAPQV